MRYEQKTEPEDIHLSEPRPRRPSAASSFHSLGSSSSVSHFHDESPDTSAESQNSYLAQRAALAPTSNSEGFLVGFSPTLPPALVQWADLITLLLDRELKFCFDVCALEDVPTLTTPVLEMQPKQRRGCRLAISSQIWPIASQVRPTLASTFCISLSH